MTAPRLALACAAAHPYDPTVLCSRLSGHWPATLHRDDTGSEWGDTGGAS